MNEFTIQSIVIAVFITITAILAFSLFYKKSLVHSHLVQTASFTLALLAVFISVYDKYISPPPPEAFAECITSGKYPPVTIECINKSKEYSTFVWEYENGTVIEERDEINRTLNSPGSYKISLIAESKGLFGKDISKFETEFDIVSKPQPAQIITSEKRFSVQGRGGSFQRTFEADPGFKIINAQLKKYSSVNSVGISTSFNNNTATVRGEFTINPHLKGLQVVVERGYFEGALLLTQQRIQ